MTELPSLRRGSAFCTLNRRPLTFALNVLSKCSSVIAPSAANCPVPALANRMSMCPFCCFTVAYKRSRSARFETSPCTAEMFLPICFTAASSSPLRRPVIKTYAPSATKRCAVARPIPLLPPVMTATFPSSLSMSFLLFDFLFLAPHFRTAWYRCHGRRNGYNICTDRYERGIIDRYGTEQIPKTNGTSPRLRYRPSVGPSAGGVLAKGI